MSETVSLTESSRTLMAGAKQCWITSGTAKQSSDKLETSIQRGRGPQLPLALLLFCPGSRAVQAAVCKAAYVSATLTRDSIFPGIGVERYTPVFQTGIQGAIP